MFKAARLPPSRARHGVTFILAWLWLAAPALGGAPSPSPSPSPSASASAGAARDPVIIFLVDNSASLPPLDPEEKRVAALQRMFQVLEGHPYRLILFGGRREITVDDVSRYRNDGQWTDFYYAFEEARTLMKGYPAGTEFRFILLTDALIDPKPADWQEGETGQSPPPEPPRDPSLPTVLRSESARRTVDLVKELKTPLYVILVGEPPAGGLSMGDREQAPPLVMDLVRAANGPEGGRLAQTLASFFEDNGVLVKKYIFRVRPNEGLKKVEPAVRRIVTPPRPTVELRVFSYMVLPLVLFVLLSLGIMVRSFPGPGDLEVVELASGEPLHVAVDRLHRLNESGWGRGLSLVGSAKDATATFVYQAPPLELTGAGLDLTEADALTTELLPLGLEDLRRSMHRYATEGSKEEKIQVLNLEYISQNMEPEQAERLLQSASAERRRVAPADFLRAKAHLLGNEALRRKLTQPRVYMTTYGRDGEKKELVPGSSARLAQYGFVVKDVSPGGRKDARLVLYYDRIPSLFGLKTWLPDVVQRVFRLRRSSQRIVS
jgi:hypothetical protein